VFGEGELTGRLTACTTRAIPGFPATVPIAGAEVFSLTFEGLPIFTFAFFPFSPFLFVLVTFGKREFCTLRFSQEPWLWG
jgi:hypothetical protein